MYNNVLVPRQVNKTDQCWQFTQRNTLYRTHPYFIHYNYKQVTPPSPHTHTHTVTQSF